MLNTKKMNVKIALINLIIITIILISHL
jgi:hypothetical protein